MPSYDVDLFVIGGGSAGVRLSRMSASFGARVMMAEEKYLGGTCVNVGCVPKKLFSYGAHFAEDFEDAAGWMAYLLPLAHTPDYRARVLLAMSSCFLHQGKIAGDYA